MVKQFVCIAHLVHRRKTKKHAAIRKNPNAHTVVTTNANQTGINVNDQPRNHEYGWSVNS